MEDGKQFWRLRMVRFSERGREVEQLLHPARRCGRHHTHLVTDMRPSKLHVSIFEKTD